MSKLRSALLAPCLLTLLVSGASVSCQDSQSQTRLVQARLSVDESWKPCEGSPSSFFCAEELPDRKLDPVELEIARLRLGWADVSTGGAKVPQHLTVGDRLALHLARGLRGAARELLEAGDLAASRHAPTEADCFNAALAFESIDHLHGAQHLLSFCEEIESSNAWREEIQKRLQVIAARLGHEGAGDQSGGAYRTQRAVLLETALPEDGQAATSACAEAVVDAPTQQLCGSLQELTGSGTARSAVEAGLQSLRLGEGERAERRFAEAARHFERAGSTLSAYLPLAASLADAYRGQSLFELGRYAEADEVLGRVAEVATTQGYCWAAGVAHWNLGRLTYRNHDVLGAAEHRRLATRHFTQCGANGLAASSSALLAKNLSTLGLDRAASEEALTALRLVHQSEDFEGRRFFVYNILTDVMVDLGLPALALEFQATAAELSEGMHPRVRANTKLWTALHLVGRERLSDATHMLAAARVDAERMAPGREREITLGELGLASAVAMRQDPETAEQLLTRSIAFFEETVPRPAWVGIALGERAELRRDRGDLEGASDDLHGVLELLEPVATQLQGDPTAELARLTRVLATRSAADRLVELQVQEMQRPWLGFQTVQRLLGQLNPGRVLAPFDKQRFERLNDNRGATVVLYQTGAGLAGWWSTGGRASYFGVEGVQDPEGLARRLRRAEDSESYRLTAGLLFEQLVRPWIEDVGSAEALLIVPGPGLDGIPFAGLYDTDTGRYLVQDHVVQLAPFLAAAERPAPRIDSSSVLVVGSNELAASAEIGLPSLGFAEVEAREVFRILGSSGTLIVGSEQADQPVTELMRSASLLHYAGHAVPIRSGEPAIFGGGKGELVRSTDVLELDLTRLSLVSLSACDSAGAPDSSWQQSWSLARAFLAAGAQSVVASLNAVDDETSREFFTGYYQSLQNESPDVALAITQRSAIRAQGDAPPRWPYYSFIRGPVANRNGV